MTSSSELANAAHEAEVRYKNSVELYNRARAVHDKDLSDWMRALDQVKKHMLRSVNSGEGKHG